MTHKAEAMVDVPEVIHIAGDYVLRHRGADVGEVREGDLLIIVEQETAEAGQHVVTVSDDGDYSVVIYEEGVKVSGLIAGLMRRLP